MTKEEYKKRLGFRPNNKTVLKKAPVKDISSLPDSVDWRA
jgi:hypothetical protein